MKKYNTVIFDLDGTLLNTLKDLTDATNYALEKYGQPQHSIEDVRKFVGNGVRKLYLQLLKNIMVSIVMIPPVFIRAWKK